MKAPDHLETDRLILRKPVIEDAPAVFSTYAQDPDVTKYLTWKPHENIEVTQEVINNFIKKWNGGSEFSFMIILREEKKLIGNISIRFDSHGGNLGYVLAKEYWGNGYMTEALQSVITWAFAQGSVYRVWAVFDIENEASGKVMEKAGMQYEGILRKWLISPNISDIPRDCKCYSIVKLV